MYNGNLCFQLHYLLKFIEVFSEQNEVPENIKYKNEVPENIIKKHNFYDISIT